MPPSNLGELLSHPIHPSCRLGCQAHGAGEIVAAVERERDQARLLLAKIRRAYQGVGDFETTGENMVELIPEIDALLLSSRHDG